MKEKDAFLNNVLVDALEYVKITYYGFQDCQYEVAVKIGDENNFKNMERQLVNLEHKPYIARIGKTYHQLFLDRVDNYFRELTLKNITINK